MARPKKVDSEAINSLEIIKKKLQEEIAALEIQQNTLNEQNHRLKIKLEGDRKVAHVDAEREFHKEKEELIAMSNKISERESGIELKELRYAERLKELERREAKLGIIDLKFKALNEERSDFLSYKKEIEKKLDEARIIIAESAGQQQQIDIQLDHIKGRERKLEKRERDLDAWEGILRDKERQFALFTKNEMEAVNV